MTIKMEHLDKQREKLTLHWLPSTLTAEGVKKLVEAETGDLDPEIYKLKDLSGRCGGGGGSTVLT